MSHEAFDEAVSRVCPSLREMLLAVPCSVKATASEVRLRTGRFLAITAYGRAVFVLGGGRIAYERPAKGRIVTADEVFESFRSLCDYSVHVHQKEINNGFISLSGGHRAGVSGRAVGAGEAIENVREISSINIRIARQVPGCGHAVAKAFLERGDSIIIAGPPGSGKTTLLRDTVRLLSDGELGQCHNVAVVDERHEIGGTLDGMPQFDLGCCTDIFSGYPKAHGVLAALRAMSPQVIAFDEIGDSRECAAVAEGLNSGVRFIITMHAGSRDEIFRRPVSRLLLETGAFGTVFILCAKDGPGQIKEVVQPYECIS